MIDLTSRRKTFHDAMRKLGWQTKDFAKRRDGVYANECVRNHWHIFTLGYATGVDYFLKG